MKVRDAIKRLEEDGWAMLPRKATNHRQFKHPTKPGKVTVSGSANDDIPPKTWADIQKQAGWR